MNIKTINGRRYVMDGRRIVRPASSDALEQFAADVGATIDARRIHDRDGMFRWLVRLNIGGREHETTYGKGAAHVQAKATYLIAAMDAGLPAHRVGEWVDLPPARNRKVAVDELARKHCEPIPPTAPEVLAALALDVIACEECLDLDDFAANYCQGQPPSKALASWDACQSARRFLLSALGGDGFGRLVKVAGDE